MENSYGNDDEGDGDIDGDEGCGDDDDGGDDDSLLLDGQALRSRCWTRRQGNDYFIPCGRGTSSPKVL